MSTLQEIEQAIERLSDQEKSELRAWLDSLGFVERVKQEQDALSERLEAEVQKLAAAAERVSVLETRLNQASDGSAVAPSMVRPARYQHRDQWIEAFNRWVDSNRDVTAVADDSRESIYAGRGE
ncbi:hypothetical protein [Lacipirellula sp.]|uniref:hypothetical protein n=1 Tax=Lacipirellula sp. TaxID=2691419 RepID=UPI003D09C94A